MFLIVLFNPCIKTTSRIFITKYLVTGSTIKNLLHICWIFHSIFIDYIYLPAFRADNGISSNSLIHGLSFGAHGIVEEVVVGEADAVE